MTTAANPPPAEALPLPRLSDDTAAEIRHFLEYLFDLFEARYGDQVTRFYESMARENLVESDANPQPGDPPF